MTKLHRHGLIAQHQTGLRGHASTDGRPPLLYSLTKRGMEVAQTREPPAISRRREWRATEQGRALRLAHDLHALAWAIELHRLVGDVATDHWRTPRYATGRYTVPQVSGRNRHPITLNEIPLAYKQTIIDLGLETFAEIKPDVSLELRIPSMKLSFDLLVELDLTERPSTTTTSCSPTTRSCAAGASPTLASRRRALARSWCSCAPSHGRYSRWRAKPTRR